MSKVATKARTRTHSVYYENWFGSIECLDFKIVCPVSNDFLSQIFSIPIHPKNAVKLKDALYNKYKIKTY